MISAKFLLIASGNGKSILMDVKGHASFAEMGKDPVCAGASILAMTLTQCVKDMEAAQKLKKKANIKIRSGRVATVCTPKQEHFNEAMHLYYVAQRGMQLLAESYPDNVELTPFVIPQKG